jgi:choline kinase
LSQVLEWLSVEKAKRKKRSKAAAPSSTDEVVYDKTANTSTRSSTELSDADLALERLERILALDQDAVMPIEETSHLSKRKSSPRRLRKNSTAASSDTEYQDGDAIVPSVDAILDNSKTMGYTGGSASSTELKTHAKQDAKDKEGWLIFKNEIVRLAHTLRLKGWRRVPLNAGADIGVERLSGALTNAVYVVSPPKQFTEASATNSSTSLSLKKPPP